MCGIVGYAGAKQADSVLTHALSFLEYRGYDSAGVSVFTESGIATCKKEGRLANLAEALKAHPLKGTCGIGHTRWATHGEPSDINAHPHGTDRLSLIHNGIIENYRELKEKLMEQGYTFVSSTDTEVAAKLIDSLYDGDPIATISRARSELEGSYAFAIMFADHPGTVYAARLVSPLIAARADGENFVASDVPAILQYTREYCFIEEDQVVAIEAGGIHLFTAAGDEVEPVMQTAAWTVEQAQRGGYEHFMLKEIHEQPKALMDTIHPRIKDGLPCFEADGIPAAFWKQFERICIVACGTAMHAGMVGKNLIETLARIPVECDVASEFRYRNPILDEKTLVLLISQSGETADTLAALRLAKSKGVRTLAVVNVAGSSIAREADDVIHTYAGLEIAVASTKAYSVQLASLYLIAMELSLARETAGEQEIREMTAKLLGAVQAVEKTLSLSEEIKDYVGIYKDLQDLFFIGRGLDYALSMEGSLKLKEISYIHCEAYAAGELKHGTISLITKGVPVVAVATQDAVLQKTVSNIKEVSSRGARVLLFCKSGAPIDPDAYEKCIRLPDLGDFFMPLVGVVVLQLLAYHTAVLRGCDVDKPRNLAKSVTVE